MSFSFWIRIDSVRVNGIDELGVVGKVDETVNELGADEKIDETVETFWAVDALNMVGGEADCDL